MVHTLPDTTLDVDVNPDDLADMTMTKYSLNLFDKQSDESVYKLLVDDMTNNMSMTVASATNGGGDVNDGFRPKLMSKLEETAMGDETLNLSMAISMATGGSKLDRSVSVAAQNKSLNRPPPLNCSTTTDILEQRTSPFPVHQENMRHVNGSSALSAPGRRL